MIRKQENRPPIGLRADRELVDALDNMAIRNGTTRSAIMEDLLKNALGNPVLKPSSPVIAAGQEKDKDLKIEPVKTAKALPVSAKKGFWDFMDDMPNLFGNTKALDKLLADPAKLAKDSQAAMKTMKKVAAFAAISAALAPVLLPYIKEQLANVKKERAAEAGTVSGEPLTVVTGQPLGPGKEPFTVQVKGLIPSSGPRKL